MTPRVGITGLLLLGVLVLPGCRIGRELLDEGLEEYPLTTITAFTAGVSAGAPVAAAFLPLTVLSGDEEAMLAPGVPPALLGAVAVGVPVFVVESVIKLPLTVLERWREGRRERTRPAPPPPRPAQPAPRPAAPVPRPRPRPTRSEPRRPPPCLPLRAGPCEPRWEPERVFQIPLTPHAAQQGRWPWTPRCYHHWPPAFPQPEGQARPCPSCG